MHLWVSRLIRCNVRLGLVFTKPNFWQNKNIPGWKQNGRSIITRHICIRYIVCCRSDVRWTILHNISFKSLMQVSYFLYSMICKEIVPHSAGWELFTKYALCTCYLVLLLTLFEFFSEWIIIFRSFITSVVFCITLNCWEPFSILRQRATLKWFDFL